MNTVHLVTVDPRTEAGMLRLLDWMIEHTPCKLRGVPEPGGGGISVKFTPKGLIGEVSHEDLDELLTFGDVTFHGTMVGEISVRSEGITTPMRVRVRESD